jgi:biopolymer transport protein ExbB
MVTLLAKFAPLLAAEATSAAGHRVWMPDWAKGNPVFELFFKGGPVMYPILIVIIVALAVILERFVWWTIERSRRDSNKLDKIYGALEQGNVQTASSVARGSKDPIIRMIWHGLNHVHSSLQGALSVAAGVEIQRAGRFMSVMDTVITLGPLLGLLGTVTGIMGSFAAVDTGGLNPSAVSGGIAEALIATACGLGIAIATLIPFNYYNTEVAKLQFELETAANNVVVMLDTAKRNKSLIVEEDARQSQQFAHSN